VFARREDQRLLVRGAQRDDRRPGRFYFKAPEDRLVVDARLAGLPGADRQRIGTRPATQSTRRMSSRVGPRSWLGKATASVTRTTPWPVVNVVSNTLVSGR
jgi:hypothetical protein